MLSNTRGYQRNDHILGYRKDSLTAFSITCPNVRRNGKCKEFNIENTIRRKLVKDKNDELHKRALVVYAQLELLEKNGNDSGKGATGSCFSTNSACQHEVVQKLVEELKQEPEFIHWNLEAAVEERMVQRGLRRCHYSHQPELKGALKRSRAAWGLSKNSDDSAQGSGSQGSVGLARVASTPMACASPIQRAWDKERARVFASLTPMQRCVACLLWQQKFCIPRHVVCDVRQVLQQEADIKYQYDTKAREAYLVSQDFENAVADQGRTLLSYTTCRPDLGIFNFTALPKVVSYISCHPKVGVLSPATVQYFCRDSFAPEQMCSVVLPSRLTTKELDLSCPARAMELVEVLEWMLHVYCMERQLCRYTARECPDVSDSATVVRSLCFQSCELSNAEALIDALRKRHFQQTLLAVDLSLNRIASLRFLFVLRAHFAERLLRLSLRNNPITRKPEYQEQVRRSLPRLTALDGEPIRRPPLRFPKPWSASAAVFRMDTAVPLRGVDAEAVQGQPTQMPRKNGGAIPERGGHGIAGLSREEYDLVVSTIECFLYILETHRIPRTEIEKNVFAKKQRDRAAYPQAACRTGGARKAISDLTCQEEEEMNEDNFPYRYLHPSATFSFTSAPGLTFFNASRMRLDREVELDEQYDGMRLSAHDVKDIQVFDVSMKGGSRNLLNGHDAVLRFGRGADKCFLAYKYSLYPERAEVCHHIPGATISVQKISNCSSDYTNQGGNDGVGVAGRTFAFDSSEIPYFYLATLHGTMTWRFPSMRQNQSIASAFDRTFILVQKTLPARNTAWERRRSPKLVMYSDQVLLRSVENSKDSADGFWLLPLYRSACTSRLSRLVVQYGLEACKDGAAFVRAVMERTTSDAAEEATLSALVFGVHCERTNITSTEEGSVDQGTPLPPHVQAANEAAHALVKLHSDRCADSDRAFSFHVGSLLGSGHGLEGCVEGGEQTDGDRGRLVTVALIHDVATIMNKYYTFHCI